MTITIGELEEVEELAKVNPIHWFEYYIRLKTCYFEQIDPYSLDEPEFPLDFEVDFDDDEDDIIYLDED